jgi:hypothetical protein
MSIKGRREYLIENAKMGLSRALSEESCVPKTPRRKLSLQQLAWDFLGVLGESIVQIVDRHNSFHFKKSSLNALFFSLFCDNIVME